MKTLKTLSHCKQCRKFSRSTEITLSNGGSKKKMQPSNPTQHPYPRSQRAQRPLKHKQEKSISAPIHR